MTRTRSYWNGSRSRSWSLGLCCGNGAEDSVWKKHKQDVFCFRTVCDVSFLDGWTERGFPLCVCVTERWCVYGVIFNFVLLLKINFSGPTVPYILLMRQNLISKGLAKL